MSVEPLFVTRDPRYVNVARLSFGARMWLAGGAWTMRKHRIVNYKRFVIHRFSFLWRARRVRAQSIFIDKLDVEKLVFTAMENGRNQLGEMNWKNFDGNSCFFVTAIAWQRKVQYGNVVLADGVPFITQWIRETLCEDMNIIIEFLSRASTCHPSGISVRMEADVWKRTYNKHLKIYYTIFRTTCVVVRGSDYRSICVVRIQAAR